MKNIQEEIDKAIKSTGKMGQYLLKMIDNETLDNMKKEIENFLTQNSCEDWKSLVLIQLSIYDTNIKSGMPKEAASVLFRNAIGDWVELYGNKQT